MRKRIRLSVAVLFTLSVLSMSLLRVPVGWADPYGQKEVTKIKIGALLPLRGELSSKGAVRQFAVELGVQAANERWQTQEKPLRLELIVQDSKSDPETALAAAEKLWKEGIRIFIAGSSAEIERLQPWADDHEAVVISYSSTSPSLAVAGDSVFRMVPDDSNQSKALAALLVQENIYGITPVYRKDAYGQQLADYLEQEFAADNGIIAKPVMYDPATADWDAVAQQIAESVSQLDMDDAHKAVVMLSFDEAAQLLKRSKAAGDIRWFGSDTVALSPAITDDPQAAGRAAEVRLTGVSFGIPDLALAETVRETITGPNKLAFIPDALFAYDIPGLLASSIEQLKDPLDAVALRKQLVELSGKYEGATGWTVLNNEGDRKYYHYDVWQVEQASAIAGQDKYQWKKIMKYLRSPGTPGYLTPLESGGEEQEDLSFLFGYEGTASFDPERPVTRTEFIYMLMHALKLGGSDLPGSMAFTDAGDIDKRAAGAVHSAWGIGIVKGYANGEFRPLADITVAEAYVMLNRAWQYEKPASGTKEKVSGIHAPEWAKPSIIAAIEQGLLVPGDSGADYGSAKLTLGEASLLMIELMKRSAVSK